MSTFSVVFKEAGDIKLNWSGHQSLAAAQAAMRSARDKYPASWKGEVVPSSSVKTVRWHTYQTPQEKRDEAKGLLASVAVVSFSFYAVAMIFLVINAIILLGQI